jgi:hypothetical protein
VSAFEPTHVVPTGGLATWPVPNASIPAGPALEQGLRVQVTERVGDWAKVVCDNGWTGWVDARGLVVGTSPAPAPAGAQPGGPGAGVPTADATPAGPAPLGPAVPAAGGRSNTVLYAVVAAVAVIGLVIGLVVVLGGGSSKHAAAASEIFRQPAGTPGRHPFMPNVGTNVSVPPSVTTDLPTTPPNTLSSFTGDTVGLYGGTKNLTSCDAAQMVQYLQANPDKAAAWAAAQGIPVSQLPSYISGLTPVTLRYDTRVTNHGFNNGQANPIPEILEAGQAVLVDSSGVPRARCYCGNPLTPPEPVSNPTYTGTSWPSFTPGNVIVVQPSPTPVSTFTLVDSNTGQEFGRPVGTSGKADGPPQVSAGQPAMPGVTGGGASTTTTTVPGSTSTTTTTKPSASTTTPPASNLAIDGTYTLQNIGGSASSNGCHPDTFTITHTGTALMYVDDDDVSMTGTLQSDYSFTASGHDSSGGTNTTYSLSGRFVATPGGGVGVQNGSATAQFSGTTNGTCSFTFTAVKK